MKITYAYIVLIGFITIALFGIVLMPYDGSHHDRTCLASLIKNLESPCPQDDPLGFANFHYGVFHMISNPTLAGAINFGAVGLILIMAAVFLTFRRPDINHSGIFLSYGLPINAARPKITATLAWFSLHENSPSRF